MDCPCTPSNGKRIDARLIFDESDQLYHLSFHAMGTNCRILYQAESQQRASEFAIHSTQWTADFETKYSRFRDDSLICAINRAAGTAEIDIDEDASRIFDLCGEIHYNTRGILDASALPIIELWDYRRTPTRLPSQSEIAEALQIVGWEKIHRSPNRISLPREGMKLDLGGFGKEFAVDQVAEIAIGHGVQSFLIDFGRDIRVGGPPPGQECWSIGVADACNAEHTLGTVYLRHQSIATSGNYIRNFHHSGQTFGHIVDPRIGRPLANSALAATAIARTCLEAGTLSSSACILGLEEGLETIEHTFGAEGLVSHQHKRLTTSGFYEYALLD